MTLVLTGLSTLSISTAREEAWHLQAANTVVYVWRVTAPTTLSEVLTELPGRDATPRACVVTAKCLEFVLAFLMITKIVSSQNYLFYWSEHLYEFHNTTLGPVIDKGKDSYHIMASPMRATDWIVSKRNGTFLNFAVTFLLVVELWNVLNLLPPGTNILSNSQV